MLAKKMLEDDEKFLVGRWIITEPMGIYPGGPAIVTEIRPDPNAEDIVFNVFKEGFGEIGIFDNEEVKYIDQDNVMFAWVSNPQ